MKIYIKNHPFHYEIENITRLFFPYEKLQVVKFDGNEITEYESPYILTEINDEISVTVNFKNFQKSETTTKTEDEKENERLISSVLYNLLTEYTGIKMPWGMITGIRPVKYFRNLKEDYSEEYAKEYFKNSYFVSDEKINLAKITEKYEKDIINSSKENSFSLYVSIPFVLQDAVTVALFLNQLQEQNI